MCFGRLNYNCVTAVMIEIKDDTMAVDVSADSVQSITDSQTTLSNPSLPDSNSDGYLLFIVLLRLIKYPCSIFQL